MKTPKETERTLKSSFSVMGKLRVPMHELYAHLESASFLSLVKAGEPQIYSINEAEGVNNSELQISGNKLTFIYRFQRSSTREYARNLLKFLSILAYLGDLYEPELKFLYPAITEVLVGYAEESLYSNKKIENSDLLIRQIKALSSMNCSLSLKILEFQLKCKNLEDEKSNLAKFSKDAIENAMAHLSIKNPDATNLPKVLGTTSEVYEVVQTSIFGRRVTK